MGVARLKAGLDADGWPIALDVRTAMQEGRVRARGVLQRDLALLRSQLPLFASHDEVPRAGRHAPRHWQAANEFYRESFMDELARAAGKDPYRYRRELLSRTKLPYKADMIKALDMAAEMSGWGTPLPRGTARADRARGAWCRDQRQCDDQRHGAHGIGEP
jgi:isoquinoline 1-oxidoreductase beta subunit